MTPWIREAARIWVTQKGKIKAAGWVFAVLIVYWTCSPAKQGESARESVGEYRDQLIAEVNHDLENPDNPIRRKIENAHVTVTAKSANVTSCSVYTVDGSNNAGKNGGNVSEIDMVITVMWDGWIDKNGFTEFEVDYDNQNRVVKNSKYLRSSAMINLDTVDWYSVGTTVGGYIAAASM